MPLPIQIDVETLDDLRRGDAPPLILDVREPVEVGICSLDGSIHIPLGDLPLRVGELPKDRPVVVMCHHGVRSAQATLWLRSQGFNEVSNLGGGIDAWARRIDPNMKVY